MTLKSKFPAISAILILLIVGGLGLLVLGVGDGCKKQQANQGQGGGVDKPAENLPVEGNSPHKHLDGTVAFFGYEPDRDGTQKFLQSLPKPTIKEAGPGLFGDAESTEPVLLYRALYDVYASTHDGAKWNVGAQGIGDCVSWGWKHGVDIHLAVMFKLGDTAEWKEAASESIYGGSRVEARCGNDKDCRGGWGDGSYGGAAAKWVKNWGVVFREDYRPAFEFDLSKYSASRAKDWGNYGSGGNGDGGKFDKEAAKHPVRGVALVRNFAEAAKAIEAGYPVPVCSGYGFSSQRDKDGFSARSGSWSHCMCFIAVRHDRKGLLCLNSWGRTWVGGPKWPDDMPDGSFWVDAKHVDGMLSGEDSFAVSGYEGFPYRNLKHGDWVETRPAAVRDIQRRLVERARGQRHETHFALSP